MGISGLAIAIPAAQVLGSVPVGTAAPSGMIPNITEAVQDADWMMGAVVTTGPMAGAFTNYPRSSAINPYQACYGALGLARASEVSGNSSYVQACWGFLDWYAAHLDGNGFAHDWDLVDGTWVEGGYDSTDAYAAMFLVACRACYQVDPNLPKLQALHPAITEAVAAIKATMQPNGLTWAQASYPAALLEDNCEVNCGLRAAVYLAGVLGGTPSVFSAQALALNTTGIETMWNASAGWYYWAANAKGPYQACDWAKLSPDTMEQAWAVAFGLAIGSRAMSLLAQITAHQPNWDKPAGNYDMTPIGWAFYAVDDVPRAQQAAANIRAAAFASNRARPFTFGDCGSLIVLETNGESLVV